MQTSILVLFIVLTLIVHIVFIYLYFSSRKVREKSGFENPLRARMWFILILTVVLAIFTSVTLPKSPYYLFAGEQPAKVVHLGAMQFLFLFSDDPIDPKKPQGDMTVELPVNELVEFRVMGLDVNHGVAIYDPSNKIIAQTQAMPGYVNNLRWKFTDTGTYKILCLEFCGSAHHNMKTSFTVK